MKKLIIAIILGVFALSLVACENTASRTANNSSSVKDLFETEETTIDTKVDTANYSAADIEADIDLTTMNSTMVFAEVSNMVNSPTNYKGKLVKMEGNIDTFHDDTTGKDYYACIIQDATACCANGIEFVLSDGNYPPCNYQTITVVGTFDTYEENSYNYCTLKDAVLLK